MSRPCQVCGGERGLTMVCTRCDRSKTFTNGERSAAEPRLTEPRLTEAEARAIVAIDKCIPLEPWGEAMNEHTGNRSAWAGLVGEARARLGCASPVLE